MSALFFLVDPGSRVEAYLDLETLRSHMNDWEDIRHYRAYLGVPLARFSLNMIGQFVVAYRDPSSSFWEHSQGPMVPERTQELISRLTNDLFAMWEIQVYSVTTIPFTVVPAHVVFETDGQPVNDKREADVQAVCKKVVDQSIQYQSDQGGYDDDWACVHCWGRAPIRTQDGISCPIVVPSPFPHKPDCVVLLAQKLLTPEVKP